MILVSHNEAERRALPDASANSNTPPPLHLRPVEVAKRRILNVTCGDGVCVCVCGGGGGVHQNMRDLKVKIRKKGKSKEGVKFPNFDSF